MKPIFYYANNIYQFSYALPVYNEIGGTFVVKDLGRYLQFKRYLINLQKHNENTFLKTPHIKIIPREKLHTLSGILLFMSNSILPSDDYKNCITIFHEHGTSDKRHGGKSYNIAKQKLEKYDYIFLSGKKNRMKLGEERIEVAPEKLIDIGGLRFDRFIKNGYSREEEFERLKIKDTTRKNILYAPTWRFGNGTIKKYGMHFIKEISKKYNLIIRPHYHDLKYSRYLKLKSKLMGINNVYFSNASNLIKHDTFNDFAVADLMLSDTSAVIYEYLVTRNPIIIIFNNYKSSNVTPDNMDIMKNADIFDGSQDIVELIEENLTKQKYRETYDNMVREIFYKPDESSVTKVVNFLKSL